MLCADYQGQVNIADHPGCCSTIQGLAPTLVLENNNLELSSRVYRVSDLGFRA